ncbi:MAG: hypothetical protein ACRCXD_04270 [Luteolibacter sp.]
MRISLALTILISALAAGVFWRDHRHLADLKNTHARLLSASSPTRGSLADLRPEELTRHTSQARAHVRELDQKAVARILRSYQDAEQMRARGDQLDQALKQQLLDQYYWITELSGPQLKLLITQALESRDLSRECLGTLLDDAVFMLAEEDPQAALEWLDRVASLFSSPFSAQSVVQVSLSRWAKDDPQAAGRWIQAHQEKYSQLITNDDKLRLMAQAAILDPGLAFTFFRDLEIKDTNLALCNIIRAGRTEEHHNAVFSALREHLAAMPDEMTREEVLQDAMFQFAAQISETGFDATTRWLASANFKPEEFDAFTRVTAVFYTEGRNDDNGKWIEWFQRNLSAEKARSHIETHMERWTEEDYQGAGKWLITAPDSPLKSTAVHAYAVTVAEADPQSATQWALTLPPGRDRVHTLRRIHDNWSKDDPSGKEAFAKDHGIK